MSCITSNIACLCDDSIVGGLIQTAVGEIADVLAWTQDTDGQVTAITMKPTKKMFAIDWEEETADYIDEAVEATVGAKNYQVGYSHKIDGQIRGQDGITKKKIHEYVSCGCGVFVINVYSDGSKCILGLRYNKEDLVGTPNPKAKFIVKTKSVSGKQLTNAKMTTIMLEGRTTLPMQNFTGSIPYTAAV